MIRVFFFLLLASKYLSFLRKDSVDGKISKKLSGDAKKERY